MLPKTSIWELKIKEVHTNRNKDDLMRLLLKNRGIIEEKEIKKFLTPDQKGFYDPFLLKDMDKAVDRIQEALERNEQITIYGDYDVDGITSTSVLYTFLVKACGAKATYYIPDRLTEGYGINQEALEHIKSEGTDLLISVDTGITACEACTFAKTIGLDVIITDHHECQEVLPDAVAVVDPKREDCYYPFKMLAGVGVTFKLIQALGVKRQIKEEEIFKYLDIVAIGTIADIVPLVDENRVITALAFKTIPNTWNIGLKALLKVSEYKSSSKMTAGFIGYRLAPRLNASGRMGDAKRGVELFLSEDEEKAIEIAEALNQENLERQALEQKIYQEAVEIIERERDPKEEKILVVAAKNWHHGVIGIVASKITERYYRPSVLLSIEDGVATGSARSVEGFSIFEALSSAKGLMQKFGGHEMAAGLSIEEDKLIALREALNTYANTHMESETLIPKLKADMALSLSDIDLSLLEKIERLEPYGMGNPEPRFVITGELKQCQKIGQSKKHLKIMVENKGVQLEAVGFHLAHYYPFFEVGQKIEVLGALTMNEWNGRKQPQMLLKDIRHSEQLMKQAKDRYKAYVMCKETAYQKLGQILKNYLVNGGITRKVYEELYLALMRYEKMGRQQLSVMQLIEIHKMDEMIKVLLALDVFKELELIDYELNLPYLSFKLIKGKKVDLMDSKLYRLAKDV